jgi:hypothetical protein
MTENEGTMKLYRNCYSKMAFISFLFFSLFTFACSHDYKWAEYRIAPNRIQYASKLTPSQVEVINAQDDKDKKVIASMGAHKWFGSLHQLSEAVVTQLIDELELHKVQVTKDSQKSISIKVEKFDFIQAFWGVRANMSTSVVTGGSYKREVDVSNFTPVSVDNAYNGAVALTVIEILNDPKIIEYINH